MKRFQSSWLLKILVFFSWIWSSLALKCVTESHREHLVGLATHLLDYFWAQFTRKRWWQWLSTLFAHHSVFNHLVSVPVSLNHSRFDTFVFVFSFILSFFLILTNNLSKYFLNNQNFCLNSWIRFISSIFSDYKDFSRFKKFNHKQRSSLFRCFNPSLPALIIITIFISMWTY